MPSNLKWSATAERELLAGKLHGPLKLEIHTCSVRQVRAAKRKNRLDCQAVICGVDFEPSTRLQFLFALLGDEAHEIGLEILALAGIKLREALKKERPGLVVDFDEWVP